MNTTTQYVSHVTEADLKRLGFSDAGVARLNALRAIYPFVEFAESAREWQRLCFLKWRREHGELS